MLEVVHHGHLIFIGSCEDSELIVMTLGQSEHAFDVLVCILHVVALIIGAHEPYDTCAIVKCCVELFDVVSCSDIHNIFNLLPMRRLIIRFLSF